MEGKISINKIYKIEQENLGQGSFATVKRGTHMKTGEKFAIKIISKT
jgi:serine/threonine protein kinase